MLPDRLKTLGLSAAALTALTGIASAQQLVLPDHMNFGNSGATFSIWRTTAGRFQAAYDSSHFTNAGVTGPIVITRLRFRAEDGQRDLGGPVYTGVTVEVGTCAVDHAALSSTFASNRGTMGQAGTANLTVLPASGAIPNDYAIDIDLNAIGATFSYDPTTGSDLLIDISFPAPVPNVALVPFSVGSATVATARARMCATGTAGALTGSLLSPPTVLVDFTGAGGYSGANGARVERYGVGCAAGSFASFYQDFLWGDDFDLANTSFSMLPDNAAAPTNYLVFKTTTPPDLTKINAAPNSVADNALVPHALGFTLNYVSGSTSTIKACTNGFIWLDQAMTSTDLSPSAGELLSNFSSFTARICPYWHDFHAGRNTALNPLAGLHVMTDTSGGAGNAVCYVTWLDVGVFNSTTVAGTSSSTLQVVLHEANGLIEMRLGQMQGITGTNGLIGFSPGLVGAAPSWHPGPRDLSAEVPFRTGADGPVHALTHNTLNTARPVMGNAITLQSFNQPVGAQFGLMMFSFAQALPGLPVPPLAPGCVVSILPPGLTVYEIFVTPTGTVSALPLTIPGGLMGAQFYTQYIAFDVAYTGYASTALKHTIGLN